MAFTTFVAIQLSKDRGAKVAQAGSCRDLTDQWYLRRIDRTSSRSASSRPEWLSDALRYPGAVDGPLVRAAAPRVQLVTLSLFVTPGCLWPTLNHVRNDSPATS